MKVYTQSFSRPLFVLILALAVTAAVSAQGTSPTGAYGFVVNATFTNTSAEGGVAILGVANFDAAGNVSGTYTLEQGSGGTAAESTTTGSFTGTYTSSTGMMTMNFDFGLTVTLAVVTDNGGHHLELVVTSCNCTFDNVVVSGVGEAQFSGPVKAKGKQPGPPPSAATLNGSYGAQLTKSSPVPASEVSVWSFNGSGSVSANGTFVGATATGPVVFSGTDTGTYTVNPDGTGAITFAAIPGVQGAQTFLFVITNGGNGLLILQTNRSGDGVLYGIGQLQ